MTFDELFEREEDSLEALLKNSNNWVWEMYKDYDTDSYKEAARCYVDSETLFVLKNTAVWKVGTKLFPTLNEADTYATNNNENIISNDPKGNSLLK